MAIILSKQVWTEEGELLFQKAEKVADFNQAKKTVDSLKKALEHYGGVGLAAPQIGISQRVLLVNISPNNNHQADLPKVGFRAYLNPEILAVSSETNYDIEGCLSVFYGTLYGPVERASYVKLKYWDINGKEQIEEITHPFHARVVLHENDHLDGKIFLQRIVPENLPKLSWNESLDIRKKDLK
ncbi:MAG TPA: peptide deformylase [Candidatus Humimicrobiaceae bacterium]|nr:peptide deformylase [Candidatus Humimicrobiaceae bacterium]